MKDEPVYYASPFPHYLENPEDPSFKMFLYEWLHIPTGTSGDGKIWMRNEGNFLKIINYWNRDKNWKYHGVFIS